MDGAWTLQAAGWLLTYVVQSTLLLGAAVLIAKRVAAPEVRERLWKCALVAAIPTSLVTTLLASQGVGPGSVDVASHLTWGGGASAPIERAADGVERVDPAGEPGSVAAEGGVTGGAASNTTVASASDAGRPDVEASPAPVAPAPVAARSRPWPWAAWLVAAAAGGALLLLLGRWRAWRGLLRDLADREPVESGELLSVLDRLCRDGDVGVVVKLSLHDRLPTPVLLSAREVCLPRRAVEQLSGPALEAVLAHELAHIRRRDPLWLWICTLLESLLFVQPLNRVGRRGLMDATEQLCDDWAARRTGRPLELAEGLAAVAGWLPSSGQAIPRPCLGEERSPLLQRVERLLAPVGEGAGRLTARAATAGMVVLTALACVVPAVHVAKDGVVPVPLADLDVPGLFALSGQLSALAAERLLALPEGYEEQHADELAVSGTRATRLLERGRFDLHPKRGGGAYFSFEAEDHDYNRWPDLELQDGQLIAGFHGGQTGHVLDLGVRGLAEVSASEPPAGLVEIDRAAFTVMTSAVALDDEGLRGLESGLRAAAGRDRYRPLGRAPLRLGHCYLVRSLEVGARARDVLAAVRVTDRDEFGISFLWRVLISRTPAGSEPGWPEQAFDAQAVPGWARELDTDGVLHAQARLREAMQERLLAVPPDVVKRHGDVYGGDDAGLVRLIRRRLLGHVLRQDGGLSYYSFVDRSHVNPRHDIGLSTTGFRTGFAGGDTGIFVDLGEAAPGGLDSSTPPPQLDERSLAAWQAAWTPLDSDTEAGYAAWRERVGDLYGGPPEELRAAMAEQLDPAAYEAWWYGFQNSADRVQVREGHGYLLRAVVQGEHDILVAFQVLDEDEYGVTLGWRLLQRFL